MPPPRLPSAPAPVELIPEGYDLLADDVTSGVGIVANKPQPAPVAPQTSERSDTELEFSAYCPRVLRCSSWQDLLVYAHVPSARAGVHADSEQFFGRSARADLSRGRPRTVVLHGAEIQVVPSLSGCEFNPPSASILWLEDWHRIDFRVRALPSDERHRFGSVRFYVGPVLVGELALWTDVATNPVTGSDVLKVEREKAYQAVFVSYSSEDTLIVDQLQHAYTVLGMSYVRDIETLRSGQDWNDSILAAIPSADIFQLCWSHAAKRSRFVEREWRCALALRRPRFIRPVFWERPMPSPPDDLAHLHFARLPLPGNTSSGNASTLSTMRQ